MNIMQITPFVLLTVRGRFDKESLLQGGDGRKRSLFEGQRCYRHSGIWILSDIWTFKFGINVRFGVWIL
jgi:hypothetical protein